MTSLLRVGTLIAVLFAAINCRAEDPAPPRLRINDPKLRQYLGKEIIISGRVSQANKSSSGHNFLNFNDNRNFSAVCFRDDVRNFKDGAPADRYKGKSVEIRGKLEQFRGKLQIKLTQPSQIKIVEPRSLAKRLGLKPVELKSTGRETWISPAGLKYSGRDPEGLTRRQHVLRHARDQPDREGPHGVFDGGEEYVFALLDKAWETKKKRNIRPNNEGGRSSYTIAMGQPVGYLGGKTGKSRGNPPLSRIFIVVRTGTSEVITAFPK